VTLASGQNNPAAVAVDGTSVYWVNAGTSNSSKDGTVMKVALGGGAPVTLASQQASPASVALDASSVYWTDFWAGTVTRVPLGGGTPVVVASEGHDSTVGLYVGASRVYWSDAASVLSAPAGGAGGAIATLASATATGEGVIQGLVGTSTQLVWTTYPVSCTGTNCCLGSGCDGGGVGGAGVVAACSLQGCAQPTVIASGASTSSVWCLAADTAHVYWANQVECPSGTGTCSQILAAPADGGAPTTLATLDAGEPQAMAVDGSNLYWTSWDGWPASSNGAVMRVPLTGGTPVIVAGDQQLPEGIVLDATSVYWVDAGDCDGGTGCATGSVMRIAKP
jgi:hypothetical protein